MKFSILRPKIGPIKMSIYQRCTSLAFFTCFLFVSFLFLVFFLSKFLSVIESMNKAGVTSGGGGGAASGPTASSAAAAAQKQRSLLQRLDNDISNIVDSFSFLVGVSRVSFSPLIPFSHFSLVFVPLAVLIWQVRECELRLREDMMSLLPKLAWYWYWYWCVICWY